MAHDEFNIDEAEDFDDGTRAVLHEDTVVCSDAEVQDAVRLRSSRKQRLDQHQSKKQRVVLKVNVIHHKQACVK